MILANFDLSFFTSIPGMLITGGVLLLLIALIIFIATGSKKGKKNKEIKDTAVNSNNEVATASLVTPTDTVEVEPTVEAAPVVDTANTIEPSVVNATPADNSMTNSSEMGSGDATVNDVNAVPTVTSLDNNTVDTPVDNSVEVNTAEPVVITEANPQDVVVTPAADVITPDVNTVSNEEVATPVVESPVVEDSNASLNVSEASAITIVDENNNTQTEAKSLPSVNEEPKSIYGGSSPVIPKIEIDNDAHRPIYGGANPLENTQSIPIVDTKSSEPVNTSEPKVDIPTVTVDSSSASPSVNTDVEVNDSVVNVPSVDNNISSSEVKPNEDTNTSTVDTTSKKEVEIESLF